MYNKILRFPLPAADQSKESRNLTLHRTCKITSLIVWLSLEYNLVRRRDRDSHRTKTPSNALCKKSSDDGSWGLTSEG